MKKTVNSGYIALITVIILGVVVTAVATSLVLLGLGHTRTSLSEVQSANAKLAADTCADDALRQIRLSSGYTGSGSLTLANATCTYTVTSNSTSSVTASGVSGNVTRRVIIDISSRSPNIIFAKWQEG